MDEQIQQIYIDVLKHGHHVTIKKQLGNRFHILTYYAYQPILMAAKHMGVSTDDLLDQTSSSEYILEDE